jgi:2-amino-4-hydroxy-6-hydroxymethyldihydropteridine diphosphokinase
LKLAYLGLGSNIGDREGAIDKALKALDSPDLRLLRRSSLYETEPIGFKDQGWFLNAVAEFETDLFPKQLLHRVQKVERDMGRMRTIRNGPRTIDLDILLFGNAIVKTEELEIPHPRYRERRFTLAPLAELNPDLRDPETHERMADTLAALSGQSIRKFHPASKRSPGGPKQC